MRHLTLAAAVLATGIAVAATAGAEPTGTPAAPTESATTTPSESATTTPTASDTATDTPTSSAASSATQPTSTSPVSSAVPAGAHQVTYTVTTTSDLTANIYYVSADPPDQAAANNPQYMPLARTQVGPGGPWTVQATLNDPTQWAFVSASGGLRVNPEFHCEIAVDGKVVVSQQGGSGVQCALRPW
jgi:cytoskeletal protein RodZ